MSRYATARAQVVATAENACGLKTIRSKPSWAIYVRLGIYIAIFLSQNIYFTYFYFECLVCVA